MWTSIDLPLPPLGGGGGGGGSDVGEDLLVRTSIDLPLPPP